MQLGIGALGDAVAHGLILRHRQPERFRRMLADLGPPDDRMQRSTGPFQAGLYAASEMFVDIFLELYRADVLKREVDGVVLHGAFFLGPRAFYRGLRELPRAELEKFRMTSISFVNDLYGDDVQDRRRARVDARFVNSAMMVTLLGAVVSDGLDDGRVVSGVGGQYNMVAQAFALDGARSVVVLPSTYEGGGKISSNIRWTYGHTTIPRHLRDIVLTEYGVADLRGRTDAEVIAAMIAVTDSRFQDGLLARARDAGKIDRRYEIPKRFRENTPERIGAALAPAREAGLLPAFPFGSEFTEIEQRLMPALGLLKSAATSRPRTAALLLRGLTASRTSKGADEAFRRLGLDRPRTLKERVYAILVRGALAQA